MEEEAEIDRLPIDLLAHILVMITSFTDLAQYVFFFVNWVFLLYLLCVHDQLQIIVFVNCYGDGWIMHVGQVGFVGNGNKGWNRLWLEDRLWVLLVVRWMMIPLFVLFVMLIASKNSTCNHFFSLFFLLFVWWFYFVLLFELYMKQVYYWGKIWTWQEFCLWATFKIWKRNVFLRKLGCNIWGFDGKNYKRNVFSLEGLNYGYVDLLSMNLKI